MIIRLRKQLNDVCSISTMKAKNANASQQSLLRDFIIQYFQRIKSLISLATYINIKYIYNQSKCLYNHLNIYIYFFLILHLKIEKVSGYLRSEFLHKL